MRSRGSPTGPPTVNMEENDEPIPRPLATKRYSGRFMVRVPPELHCRLALEAAEAGVSLNRLASTRLTYTASSLRADED